MPVFFHSPLDAKAIPELTEEVGINSLLSSTSFVGGVTLCDACLLRPSSQFPNLVGHKALIGICVTPLVYPCIQPRDIPLMKL